MFVKEIYNFINEIAPFNTAMDFDNAGLLVGGMDEDVKKIGVVLDITPDTVEYAKNNGINLIVAHHPVIFAPIKSLKSHTVTFMLAKNNINAICVHTNLDCAKGGVNDALIETLGLENIGTFADSECENLPPIGRIGALPHSMTPEEFAKHVKEKLCTDGVTYTPCKKDIKTVAVCGGSGGSMLSDVVKIKADAYVTGEAKHHELLDANNEGISLVLAGHFETENPVVKVLHKILIEKFKDISVEIIPQNSPVKRV